MELSSETKRFNSPEEELDYLRAEVARREQELGGTANDTDSAGGEALREQAISEQIAQYKSAPHSVLAEGHRMKPLEVQGIALELAPETHDDRMQELFALVEEKGIKNALSIAEAMNDPHVDDDFHRALVQYVKMGFSTSLKEKDPLYKSLHSILFEVAIPEEGNNEGVKEKALKELISSMEQFYAGMLSVSDPKGDNQHFTIEIAVANHSEESVFYISVPADKTELFEKQILSIFSNARITEKPDDYNIFNEAGASAGSYGVPSKNAVFSLKTYEKFDHDPLNVVLNSFSKITKHGEGAAIQISVNPPGDFYIKRYNEALQELQKGVPLKKATDIPLTIGGEAFKMFKDLVKPHEKKEGEPQQLNPKDQPAAELIQAKVSSPVVETNIRIIASAADEVKALSILADIESAFNQFESTGFNKIKFEQVKGKALKDFFKQYSFRSFDLSQNYPMNLKELTTLIHFHGAALKGANQLRQSKAGSAPAPLGMPQTGTLLGINRNRNVETPVYLTQEDRMRHFYNIGQTGTGKSTLLKNMIAQDIAQGHGVCYIDPHGVDIQDLLSVVPAERYDDVIYFDPGYTARPMALNMLEYDTRYPEQKTFVVNEMLSIFNKLFDMKTAGGPMFEQYFRNATTLVIEDPESGNTLLDVSRVLASKSFRELKLARCKNPIVVQFWREVADKAGGEASLANIVPYITSKFDVFLSNEIMRPIIGQEKSSFNFREIMDSRKILLVNLSKGRLGDINSSLIGLILVGKILMAALSRVDALDKKPADFYLYIDEFQNVTTNSIATILSEARKYRLSLNVAHQFIAQLEDEIKDAVFGNVGNMASFRVGADDAEYLEKQFTPVFKASDLINLDNRNAYVKMLVDGKPVKPFNIETLPPPAGNRDIVEKLKELSYLTYGGDRDAIEAAIMKKYAAAKVPVRPAPAAPSAAPQPASQNVINKQTP